MLHIDIDSLSEEQLVELNHKIVARLRFLSQMRSHSAMLDFRIGERVKFHPTGRAQVIGTLTRYNKKTVTVISDSGEHWNVAPGLLSKMDSASADTAHRDDLRVVPLAERSARK
jgi:hypothetical protein